MHAGLSLPTLFTIFVAALLTYGLLTRRPR
jgi:hypothetical protein